VVNTLSGPTNFSTGIVSYQGQIENVIGIRRSLGPNAVVFNGVYTLKTSASSASCGAFLDVGGRYITLLNDLSGTTASISACSVINVRQLAKPNHLIRRLIDANSTYFHSC